MQTKLAQLGYLPEDASPASGTTAPSRRVLAFQSVGDLERDGIVGEIDPGARCDAARPSARDQPHRHRQEVEIHRGQSVVLLIEAGRVVRVVHTSTGVGNNSTDLGTPAGSFKVTRKVEPGAWSVPFKMFWSLRGATSGVARTADTSTAPTDVPCRTRRRYGGDAGAIRACSRVPGRV